MFACVSICSLFGLFFPSHMIVAYSSIIRSIYTSSWPSFFLSHGREQSTPSKSGYTNAEPFPQLLQDVSVYRENKQNQL